MKYSKIMSAALILFSSLALIGLSGHVSRADEYGDYSYTVLSDGNCKITKYMGTEDKVNIPEYIDGHLVTEIGYFAFMKI